MFEPSWGRTELIRLRVEGETFHGRHIIGHDTRVDGGVYLGGKQREAIVVDTKVYPALSQLYRYIKANNPVDPLTSIYRVVAGVMPNMSNTAVHALTDHLRNDDLVPLDYFIERNVGVCRHHALACAALAELFVKDGTLHGLASVDRNTGHAWCRYTTSRGDIVILDVTQRYCNYLSAVPRSERWPYERPEEIETEYLEPL